MRPSRIRDKEMIADVEIKGSWIATINEQGKKIKEVPVSSIGELLGFTGTFVVCQKGSWVATYDMNFKKIKEVPASSVGMFKNAAGQTMTFVKGSWIATYDVMFKKTNERPNR